MAYETMNWEMQGRPTIKTNNFASLLNQPFLQNNQDELNLQPVNENSDNIFGDNQAASAQGYRRKHRHTPVQIRKLEEYFKRCPHPDKMERKNLGLALGLDSKQVKFWFQNKRTQTKAHDEKDKASCFQNENEKLRAEIQMLRDANSSVTENCEKLLGENAKLHEQVEHIASIAAKFMGKPV